MRSRNGNPIVASAVLAAAVIMLPQVVRATTYTYDFDNGQVTGSAGAGTPLINSTTAGTLGQDNWILTSGASPVIRTDPIVGFSGNYAMSPTVSGTTTLDGILTRKNDSNFSYSLSGSTLVITMDLLVGAAGGGTTQFRRSEMSLGVDLNDDGKIRPTALTAENPEIAFFMGYEANLGWYVRPSAFGTAVTSLPQTTPSGIWRAQLVVDLAANPKSGNDAQGNPYSAADGAGSLYIKQLSDAGGNAVSDVFHAADASLLNVNLGITRMATVAGGAAYAADPMHWNGLMIRTASNGGMDNISISTDPIASPPQWALNNTGLWITSGNWYPSAVPNGVGAVAEFGAAITGAHTIVADSNITVGTLHINNANTYVLAGAGTLTMQTASGNAQILVDSGAQKINLPLVIASNTTLNVANGASLKISDPVTVSAGKTITQTGGGTVTYESNVTLENGSILALTSTSSLHALALSGSTNNWSSTLDVSSSGAVLRTGSLADVANQLKSGYSNGTWNGAGVTSAAAKNNASHTTGIAYASAASLLGLSGSATATWNGQTVDASSILLDYTYFGDANMDGKVNADDYALTDRGLAKHLTGWTNGDFNYDGTVDGGDFLLIDRVYIQQGAPLSPDFLAQREAEFGSEYVSQLLASVPEPTSLGMLGVVAGLTLQRCRRRGRAK